MPNTTPQVTNLSAFPLNPFQSSSYSVTVALYLEESVQSIVQLGRTNCGDTQFTSGILINRGLRSLISIATPTTHSNTGISLTSFIEKA